MALLGYPRAAIDPREPTSEIGFGAKSSSLRARSAKSDDTIVDMKAQLESSPQEVLAGLVERVTYHNAENGFCVLRAKARGHRDVVTVVGHAASIAAGGVDY